MEEDRYTYNSVTVACYIVALANSKRYGINMTKLQKLLYVAYGVYLAVKNERLTNEHPQAWPYGPVFPTTRSRLVKRELDAISLEDPSLREIQENQEMTSLMKIVFDTYGLKNASTLSEWSHKPGSPWEQTVNHPSFKWGDTIPDEYIQEYFRTLIKKKDA